MSAEAWFSLEYDEECPVCGHGGWCRVSPDGAVVACRREESDSPRQYRDGSTAWLHYLEDPDPSKRGGERVEREPLSDKDADLRDRAYRSLLAHLGLSERHMDALHARGLSDDAIATAGYASLPGLKDDYRVYRLLDEFTKPELQSVPGLRYVERKEKSPQLKLTHESGLLVPVRDVAGRIVALKIRNDRSDPKYIYFSKGAPGSGSHVHVPVTAIADHNVVRVTEGELKADLATQHTGILTVSVPGVASWALALPVLATLGPRRVLVAFDADKADNDHVARAEHAFAAALRAEGYEVVIESWDLSHKGIDDALAAGAPITTWSQDAFPVADAAPYRLDPTGIVKVRSDGEPERLTNFAARILATVEEDDGQDRALFYEIAGQLLGGDREPGKLRRFTVPVEEFASMRWVAQLHTAAELFVYTPARRSEVASAIKLLSGADSGDWPLRRAYAHTGWRDIDGQWVYLHAGDHEHGACALPEELRDYALPPIEDEAAAVRASLGLLELADARITAPVYGAIWRAILGDADFGVHLVGRTGRGKTCLATLAQQHFGAAWHDRHLPGDWSSTANALEAKVFYAKDALIVIDEYVPTGSERESTAMRNTFRRVMRAQGNRAARSRLTRDTKLGQTRRPRGLVLSTGEDIVGDPSLLARLVVVDVDQSLLGSRLSKLQAAGSAGLFAQATAGFVAWLAPMLEQRRETFTRRSIELRERFHTDGAHARNPVNAAALTAALEMFFEYAVSVEVITQAIADENLDQIIAALSDNARNQAAEQAGSDPVERYLEILRTLLATKQVQLASTNVGPLEGGGELLGYRDSKDVYLLHQVAYSKVIEYARRQDTPLGITINTLHKQLHDRGLLVSRDHKENRYTVRKYIRSAEAQLRLLHLHASTLFGDKKDTPQLHTTWPVETDQSIWLCLDDEPY